MQEPKINVMTYLRLDQHRSLKDISEKTGIPMAKMIRDAIDKYLEQINK